MSSVLELTRHECPSRKCKGRMATFEKDVCVHCGYDRLAPTRTPKEPVSCVERAIAAAPNKGRERLRLKAGNHRAIALAERNLPRKDKPDPPPKTRGRTVFGRGHGGMGRK